eukprot:scaffold261788_cov18-Tisochrysis_lutea.AAC.1
MENKFAEHALQCQYLHAGCSISCTPFQLSAGAHKISKPLRSGRRRCELGGQPRRNHSHFPASAGRDGWELCLKASASPLESGRGQLPPKKRCF